MDINDEILGYRVQGTADWRRRKAKEFPNDHRKKRQPQRLIGWPNKLKNWMARMCIGASKR